MQLRELGAGGPKVSAVGMGTWQTLDTPEGRDDVVTAALDAGCTFVDSSPMYGEAERALAQGLGERRDQAFVATKLWMADDAEAEAQPERALRWYGRVDLYQVHNLLGTDKRLDLLERLRDEGRVAPATSRRWGWRPGRRRCSSTSSRTRGSRWRFSPPPRPRGSGRTPRPASRRGSEPTSARSSNGSPASYGS